MKRYERMSKEDIIKEIAEAGFQTDFCKAKCKEKPLTCSGRCNNNLSEWLNEEVTVKKVPRLQTIKTEEGMRRATDDFRSKCRPGAACGRCPYKRYDGMRKEECFANYLCEEIEVEENDT